TSERGTVSWNRPLTSLARSRMPSRLNRSCTSSRPPRNAPVYSAAISWSGSANVGAGMPSNVSKTHRVRAAPASCSASPISAALRGQQAVQTRECPERREDARVQAEHGAPFRSRDVRPGPGAAAVDDPLIAEVGETDEFGRQPGEETEVVGQPVNPESVPFH